jgi:hypothetical protein
MCTKSGHWVGMWTSGGAVSTKYTALRLGLLGLLGLLQGCNDITFSSPIMLHNL